MMLVPLIIEPSLDSIYFYQIKYKYLRNMCVITSLTGQFAVKVVFNVTFILNNSLCLYKLFVFISFLAILIMFIKRYCAVFAPWFPLVLEKCGGMFIISIITDKLS